MSKVVLFGSQLFGKLNLMNKYTSGGWFGEDALS